MSENTKKKLFFSKIDAQDLLIIAFAVIIFFLNFMIVGDCYNPFVFNDEAGYWTHAATMAGYDWKGFSSTLAWYSFGYSFMLLPIIKLFGSSVVMYRAALILNIIMQIAVYFMYVYILRFVFPDIKKAEAGFVAAAAVLYTSYQHNSGIAFSETALLFVTTLIVCVIVRVLKNPTYLNLGCLGALCAYLFMIHNRTIGIVASVVFVVVLAVIFKKVKLRYAVVFIVALGLGFVANSIIRHNLESLLWISGKAGGNNSVSVMTKIRAGFENFDNFKRMVSLFASQAFAAFVSTLGIALFAVWAIFRRLIKALIDVIQAVRKKEKCHGLLNDSFYVILFIFCAFISTWMISSIFMFDFERIDHVVYTRYYDIVVGLLIMTGLYYMLHAEKTDFIFIMTMPAFMLAGANRASVLMNAVKIQVFSRVCSPGISWYYDKFDKNFYAYAAVAMAAFGVIMLVLKMRVKKKNVGIFLASLLIITVFTKLTVAAREDIFRNQEVYKGDRELVQRVQNMEPDKVYVMPNVGTFASFLQFMMMDTRVDFAYHQEKLSEDALIFADKHDIMSLCEYEIVDSSDRHFLFRNRVANNEQVYELPLSFMNTFDSSFYIEEEDAIESNPSNNYVCYGPYVELAEGDYIFTLDMSFDELNEGNVGFAEIRSNSVDTVYAHTEITDDMLTKDGQLSLELTADVGIPVTDIEIVLFLYEPSLTEMQLNSIEFTEVE